MKYWVWVFGEIEGLRWVLQHRCMAFPEASGGRVRTMAAGDRAILYLSRGAYHNPTRDLSRLGGILRVTGSPHRGRSVSIAGLEFRWFAGIEPETVLPERAGPEVKPLATLLERVRRPEAWGQYFRTTPIELSVADFGVFAGAIERWAETRS